MVEPVELEPADRLCLEEARERGWLYVKLYDQGQKLEDGEAIVAHFRSMCERGLLKFEGQSGSKANMQGAALTLTYAPTGVGLALLQALERAEAAEAALSRTGPKRE
jgi:hypothetical protein